jgi:hypothetical protein
MKRFALLVAVLSLAGSSVQAEAANQPKLRVLLRSIPKFPTRRL